MAYILTIDGGSGVGKGTLSRKIAEKVNGIYLDSGAIYRASALYLADRGLDLDNLTGGYLVRACRLLKNLPVNFIKEDDTLKVYLAHKDITDKLRLETTAALASKIASIPEVRKALLERQRDVARNGQWYVLIAEGRDMGTVVFPKAAIKVFLTASAQVRAQRRYDELKAKGEDVSYEQVLEMIESRDKRDTERETAPLKPAEDAYTIDTSNLTPDEVCTKVQALVESVIFTKNIVRIPYDSRQRNNAVTMF